MKTSSISLNNQTELTGTTSTSTSKNAYSRFFCNPSLLVANFFYILPAQSLKTTTSSSKYASVPTVSGDNPVNNGDPSGASEVSGALYEGNCFDSHEAKVQYWERLGSINTNSMGISFPDVECLLQADNWQPEQALLAARSFNWSFPVDEIAIGQGSLLLRYSNKSYAKGAYYGTQTFDSPQLARETLGLPDSNTAEYVYAVQMISATLGIAGHEGVRGTGSGFQIVVGTYGTNTAVYSRSLTCQSNLFVHKLEGIGMWPPRGNYSSIGWQNLFDLFT